jgi:alpha-L-arabinofuranosidase
MTIDAASVLRTVDSSFILDGNLGPWVTPAQIGAPADRFIADRGARLIRYPGGMASTYCWKTTRALGQDGTWDDWSWSFGLDRYFTFLDSIGGRPLLGVNIFDHTIRGSLHRAADEARDLASHALAAGFAGAFYEIGNEPDQCCPVISAEEYVQRFVDAAQSVKSADPSAHVLGPAISNPDPAWRDAFIAGLARRGQLALPDTFSFHYYGAWLASWNTAAIDLSLPQQLSKEQSQSI